MTVCKFESCVMADIPPLAERGIRECDECTWYQCNDYEWYCANLNTKFLRKHGEFCRFHLTIDELNMILDPYLM